MIAYALSKDEDPGKRLWQGKAGTAIALEHRLDGSPGGGSSLLSA